MKTCWEQNESVQTRDTLNENLFADVAVIGAGMAGILTANELVQRGMSVVILEADRILSGVSSRTTAKITAQHGLVYSKLYDSLGAERTKQYAKSHLSAIEKYKELTDKMSIECDLEFMPSYTYAVKDRHAIEKEADVLQKLGISCDVKDDAQLPHKTVGAIEMKNQAQFHPVKFGRAVAEKLLIYEKSPVRHIEPNKVICDNGFVRCNYIVVATHYPIINFPGLYFLREHQERAYVEAIEGVEPLSGMYYGCDGGNSYRSIKDNTLLITGAVHRTGAVNKENSYKKLKRDAGLSYPSHREVCHWSTQDCMSHDSVPFIGQYGMHTPNMFVITGFNKWGMTSSMVAASLIADLIIEGKNEFEELYTPQRILGSSAKMFMVDLGHSVTGLGGGLFSSKERKCTHLGCRLQFNEEEQTWDCPCHGSRFEKDGKLISGPAQSDLPKQQ